METQDIETAERIRDALREAIWRKWMLVDRVISGGQSGVDQAALRAARSAGIPTGGTAPRLFLADVEQPSLDGATRWWKPEPCPWLAVFGEVHTAARRIGEFASLGVVFRFPDV